MATCGFKQDLVTSIYSDKKINLQEKVHTAIITERNIKILLVFTAVCVKKKMPFRKLNKRMIVVHDSKASHVGVISVAR